MWLFDRLVWTVMGYGMEVWEWKEGGELKRLEEKYMRWVLEVEGRTPWYMIKEELQGEKLRGGVGRRAWGSEERLGEGKENELARRCWEEMRERVGKDKVASGWEKERGMNVKEVERRREEGGM